ncbi:hypothetical protein CYMTET_42492 [Cymbomonas tetramitiformis]|uniref:IF rod domain-containing protein n=1 Tax=Cymbomonas tetramitiformis TaxID=36881 RepID=A0AAE0C415_9CHLO|nr:hypothetical protein CYMTET_42492 [Cymbomonas tetramitiformis]
MAGLNCASALDKAWEQSSFSEIALAPVSAIQGIGEKSEAAMKQLGIETVADLGQWSYYIRAKSIVALSGTEKDGETVEGSQMNLEQFIKRKDAKKGLMELSGSPCSVFVGLSKKEDAILAQMGVKTLKDLASWKFAVWAEALTCFGDKARHPAAFASPATPGNLADPLSPTAMKTSDVAHYKNTLVSLNERLHQYIEMIRDRDDTITELNANIYSLKNAHMAEMQEVDVAYRLKLDSLQLKLDSAASQHAGDLMAQLEQAKKEIEALKAKLAAKDENNKALKKERDAYYLEVGSLKKELDELTKQANDRLMRLNAAETDLNLRGGRISALEAELLVVKEKLTVTEKNVGRVEQSKKVALEQQAKKAAEEGKKMRETLLSQMHKEMDAQRKKMHDEFAESEAKLITEHTTLKNNMEIELRDTSMALTKAQASGADAQKELDKLKVQYSQLRDQHTYDTVTLKSRVTELERELARFKSAAKVSEDELQKLMGTSMGMLQEIDRYSTILTSEEDRLGISSPPVNVDSSKGKGSKRRRTDLDPPAPPAFSTPVAAKVNEPAEEGGVFSSLRKAVRPFYGGE